MSDETTREYHREMQRLRAIQGGGGDDEQPRRMTLSRIVELLLTRGSAHQSSVSLTRAASGETLIDVTVRTGDDDAPTVEAAEEKARAIYDRLRETYPLAATAESATVDLTRNAKGETQISVQVKTSPDVPTLDKAREAAAETFRTLRSRFPLSTGEREGYVGAAPDGSPDSGPQASEEGER